MHTDGPIVSEFITNIALLLYAAKWFLICFVLFTGLTVLFKDIQTQPLFRRSSVTDILYWFVYPLIYRPIGIAIGGGLLIALYSTDTIKKIHEKGLSPVADLPLWLQIILIILLLDFMQYWVHRFFHHARFWKFHAVHHSSTVIDWLSATRFHPLNIILYSLVTGAIVAAMGFRPEAFVSLVIFNNLFSCMVHCNVKWSFGPLRYVIVSPTFHRWHHAREVSNKNFAQTFPFLDLLFGTYYMPKGKQPQNFGTPGDAVPEDFIGQLLYPFRKTDSCIAPKEGKTASDY